MQYKALVFDLDGVITETASLHFKAWRDEVKKIGISYTEEENTSLKGLPRLDTLKGILKIKGVTIPEEQMIEMATAKNEHYKELLKTDLSVDDILPGIEQLLKDAKEAGMKLSVASSSFNAGTILEKINLRHYFDFIVNPGSAGKGKPAPDIFLLAAEGVNTLPSECIGFEDAMPGVIGLQAANIFTVAVTHGDAGEWDKAQLVYKSTSEFNLKTILQVANKTK